MDHNATYRRLQAAADAGEILEIIYNGGSRPGSKRKLGILRVDRDKIRARCYTSKAVKLFFVNKIEIVEDNIKTKAVDWNENKPKETHYTTLEQFRDDKTKSLSSMGWHVKFDDTLISLHRRFKNGSPLKGCDVRLIYEEYVYDEYWDGGGEMCTEKKKSLRPWIIRGTKKTGRSFGHLNKATALFMEWADELAPCKQKKDE